MLGPAAVELVAGFTHRTRVAPWARHPKPSEQPVSMIEPLPALRAVRTARQFAALPELPAYVEVAVS
jgi:hypothetical protein